MEIEGKNSNVKKMIRAKILMLVILALFTTVAYAQKFEVDEIDKFNKGHRLTTSNARLKTGLLTYIRTFRDQYGETSYFVTLFGSVPTADVIGPKDKAIFLFDNDLTVVGYSTGLQSYSIERYANMYRHQYKIDSMDIEALSEYNLKSVRKYGSRGYNDIEIPERNKDELKKIAKLVVDRLNKANTGAK